MKRVWTLLALLALVFTAPLSAAPVFVKDGLAIGGYDVVAYHTQGRPAAGLAQFTHQWNGATWRFASQQHLNLFKANPDRYAPAYGGYCAWGLAEKNELYPVDPNAWKIVDGKLYLNYNADVQRQWFGNIPGFIRQADANWSSRND